MTKASSDHAGFEPLLSADAEDDFERPFLVSSADERFFYDQPERTQLIKVLIHLVRYTQLIPFVEGPEGAGKSTLLQRFVAEAGENVRICRIDGDGNLSGEGLISAMSRAFDVPGEGLGGSAQHQTLLDHLERMRQSHVLALVAIDDAEALNTSVVELIANLAGGSDGNAALVRAVFFGTALPEPFVDAAREIVADRDLFKAVDIPPLQAHQTLEYLRGYLSAIGYGMLSPFTADNVKRIHEQTGGMPGLINDAVRQRLNNADMRDDNETQASGLSHRPLRLAAGVFIAIVVVALWRFSVGNDPATVSEGPRGEQIVQPLVLPPEGMTPAADIGGQINRPDTTAAATHATVAIGAELVPDHASGNDAADMPPLTEPSLADEARAPAGVQPATTVATGEKRPPPSVTQENRGLKRETWIRRQDPAHYTLQLVAAGREDAIVDFAKQHGLTANSAYFHTLRKGKDWYSLVYGAYSDRTSAEAAARNLPASVTSRPWIRTFGGIQADIR